jgi:hypothetical protein
MLELKYLDPEGDLITISSDVEFDEAVSITPANGTTKLLKLKMFVLSVPEENSSENVEEKIPNETSSPKSDNSEFRYPLDPLSNLHQFARETATRIQSDPFVNQYIKPECIEQFLRNIKSQDLSTQIHSCFKTENVTALLQNCENLSKLLETLSNVAKNAASTVTPMVETLKTCTTVPSRDPNRQNTSQNCGPNASQNNNTIGTLFQGLVTPQNVAYMQQVCSPQNISNVANVFTENLKTTFKYMSQPPRQNTSQPPRQNTSQNPRQNTSQNHPTYSPKKAETPLPQKSTEPTPQPEYVPLVQPVVQPQTTVKEPEVKTDDTLKEESEEEKLIRSHLEILYELGFINTSLNEEILRKFNGNLEHTIQFLFDLEE